MPPIRNARASKGVDDFYKLSKVLKDVGDKALRAELHKMVREPAKRVIPKVKQAASQIGGRGGIGAHYAKKPVRAQTRTGAKTAGVRVVMPKTDPRVDAQGRVAHPVFGRPNSTVVQKVPDAQGFFSDTINESAPEIRDGFVDALKEFTDRIVREAR